MRVRINDKEREELVRAVKAESARIGMPPETMLTIMAYETGGTLDPWQKGPKTQWGTHRGLIQMGGPQRKQYGYSKDKSITENVKASAQYFVDRGWRPGMSEVDAYSIVNAGAPGLSHRTDENNGGAPGTVADKVKSSSWRSYASQMQDVLNKYGGDDISDYVTKSENDITLGNLMAGQPGTPSAPGVFDTYQALNDMNVTAAPMPPEANPGNPANPQFADNAVGPLSQRDYGYQTARTPSDLMAAIGGPEPRGLFATASGEDLPNPTQQANVSADLSGLFAEPQTDFAAVQPTMSDDLALGTPIGPETVEAQSMGPSQRLGPRGVATSDVLLATPGVQVVQPQQEPLASPLQPFAPPQNVAPRQVAPPQSSTPTYQNNMLPNVAQSVRDNANQYDLPDVPGSSYGYSPIGSGVSRVYDNADEQTKIAASGPGLFGAMQKEFGVDPTPGMRTMTSPLSAALGAGAAAAGLGPLALAIPAANMFGATNWLADKMDVVPKGQRQAVELPKQQNGLMPRLFGGNALQGFAGGLFDRQQQPQKGLYDGNSVSFNGPIGRNPTNVASDSLSQQARDEIDRATQGLY